MINRVIIIKAINELIKLRYKINIINKNELECIHKSKNILDEEYILKLFEELKDNRFKAIEYLEKLIVVTTNLKIGYRTGVYTLEINEYLGNHIKTYQVKNMNSDQFYKYLNKYYVDNERFNNVCFIIDRATLIAKYIGEDTKKVSKPFDFRQISMKELTKAEELACPWQ